MLVKLTVPVATLKVFVAIGSYVAGITTHESHIKQTTNTEQNFQSE